MKKRIFLLGAGYSARAYARRQRRQAEAISGTTRSPEKCDALREDGIEPLIFDGTVSSEMADTLKRTTHLVLSAVPESGKGGEASDPFLPRVETRLRDIMPDLRW